MTLSVGRSAGADEPTLIENLASARAKFEAEHVRRTLEATNGNITEAARRLGMTREALSRRIHRERSGAVSDSAQG